MVNLSKLKFWNDSIIEFYCHPEFEGIIPEPRAAVKHLPEWLLKFNSHKKKDDLADSFLQGAYYFEMNSMPLISNVFNSKKKTNITL
jgi:hypothetical protein